ncbi:unnamed protein product [Nippostrongylus brasiliensis]|uniref:Secreted protein n=1 Tax=Nippostrongylus brasiliensis TaxID=27835 RepID=A0A0N4Y1P7_NIPBR|nr:unnamed protein product [Nippostrongylus brasiliensis]
MRLKTHPPLSYLLCFIVSLRGLSEKSIFYGFLMSKIFLYNCRDSIEKGDDKQAVSVVTIAAFNSPGFVTESSTVEMDPMKGHVDVWIKL